MPNGMKTSHRKLLAVYHRKNRKVVKENDDPMAATRCMMLRWARTATAAADFRRRLTYPASSVA
jgi:hypothetical protein